jgi:hypothetical protein
VSAIGIAVSTDVASSSEALCEADNYRDLINKISTDKTLYRFLPAVLIPTRVHKGLANEVNNKLQDFARTRDVKHVIDITSTLFRHGVLYSLDIDSSLASKLSRETRQSVREARATTT